MKVLRSFHDRIQSSFGDVRAVRTRQREHKPFVLIEFQNCNEATNVLRGRTGGSCKDLFVAAQFSLPAHFAVHPPDQRMKPPHNLRNQLDASAEDVAATNVD
jgi:hypothetical protein